MDQAYRVEFQHVVIIVTIIGIYHQKTAREITEYKTKQTSTTVKN